MHIFFLVLLLGEAVWADCIPAREEIQLGLDRSNSICQYSRISAAGNMVVDCFTQNFYLDLNNLETIRGQKTARRTITPSTFEAYPCSNAEGEWNFLTSPLDEMTIYDQNDIGKLVGKDLSAEEVKKTVAPIYKNREIAGAYHSCVESPSESSSERKLTIMKFDDQIYYEITLNRESGRWKFKSVTPPLKRCQNIYDHSKFEPIKIAKAKYEKLRLDYKSKFDRCAKKKSEAYCLKKFEALGAERALAEAELMQITISAQIEKPIQSVDGDYIAGDFQGKSRIWKVNRATGECQEVAALPGKVGKMSFDYPTKGKIPRVVFNSHSFYQFSDVQLWDPNTSTLPVRISAPGDQAGYGGIDRKGRVTYLSNVKDGNIEVTKIVRVDPNQISGSNKACIQAEPTATGTDGTTTR